MAEMKPIILIPHCTKTKIMYEQRELVMCKDCMYRILDGGNTKRNVCKLKHNVAQYDNWFCADGERGSDDA